MIICHKKMKITKTQTMKKMKIIVKHKIPPLYNKKQLLQIFRQIILIQAIHNKQIILIINKISKIDKKKICNKQ